MLIALTTWLVLPARGATVNFWLSNSMNGPETPTIEVLAGTVAELDVWARPADGLRLLGYSLNLVAEQPGALTFQEVEVHNPPLLSSLGTNRHQYVFDSSTDMYDDFYLQEDRIDRFFGFSLLGNIPGQPDGGGIGPDCQDSQCVEINGSPAWRIATVTFQAGTALSSTELFLEIGEHGIWHAEEAPTATSAIFGVDDVVHEWHTPMELEPDMRDMHFGLPDAVIQVVSFLANADFDDDGDVDGRDFLIWQRGYGVGEKYSQGDANGDGMVDHEDLAIWQAQYGTGSFPITAVVPEPTSLTILAALLACGAAARDGIRCSGPLGVCSFRYRFIS